MRKLVLCDDGDIETTLPLARSRGLGIEMQAFYDPALLDDAEDALRRHRMLLEGFGEFRSFHGPFADLCPGSSDPLLRQVASRRMEQGIRVAMELGADHLIFHHGYVPNTSFPPNWIARSCTFWRAILANLPSTAHVHLENHLDHAPEMLLELIERVGDPRIGICLDVGHAHAFSTTPVADWVKAAAANITYVHLHDNFGSEDQHLPLGEGSLPLREVLDALETHSPDAVWALEADGTKSLTWLELNWPQACVREEMP